MKSLHCSSFFCSTEESVRVDVERMETAQRNSDVTTLDRIAPAVTEKVDRVLNAATTLEREFKDPSVFLPVVAMMTSLRDCEYSFGSFVNVMCTYTYMYVYMHIHVHVRSEIGIFFSKGDNFRPITSCGQAKEDNGSRGQRVANVTFEGQSRSNYIKHVHLPRSGTLDTFR